MGSKRADKVAKRRKRQQRKNKGYAVGALPIDEFEPHRRSARQFFRTHDLRKLKIDYYADAAGTDNWANADDCPWWIHAWLQVNPKDPLWVDWVKHHREEYGGYIHWASEQYGPKLCPADKWMPKRRSFQGRIGRLKRIFQIPPWGVAHISIVHKGLFKQHLQNRMKRPLEKHDGANYLWTALTATVWAQSKIMSQITGYPMDRFVGSIILNNPGGGEPAKQLITHLTMQNIGIAPEFKNGGDAGIDLSDGIAWAIYRFLTKGDSAYFPWQADESLPANFHIRGMTKAFADEVDGKPFFRGTTLNGVKKWAASIELAAQKNVQVQTQGY